MRADCGAATKQHERRLYEFARRRLLRAISNCVFCALLATVAAISKGADPQSLREYQIKAVFLYNFAKFVEWHPDAFADAGSPFVIGVVGSDPFGSALDRTIIGKNINGRPLSIRRLKAGQDLRGCHILFISASETGHLAAIIGSLGGWPALTVSDMDRFSQTDGVIGLVMQENKVRFEVNATRAEQARLKISSKLLTMAIAVRRG
jgi:hypothetical protein